MKKIAGFALLIMLAAGTCALVLTTPASEAAPPCVQCPLQPLPDECPPCTEFVPQTCRRCASCKPIPGCKT